jgi:hypothetical protein
MAVSGKTTTYQVPYFLETDKPPDMGAVTKAIAERVEALLAKGGDVTIAADGTETIGDGKVTSRKFKPTAGRVGGSGLTNLTESFQTLCEFSITPAVASILLLVGSVRVLTPPTKSEAQFTLDGIGQVPATFIPSTSGVGVLLASLSLTAAAHTVKLQAKRNEGSGGSVEATGSAMLYLLGAA